MHWICYDKYTEIVAISYGKIRIKIKMLSVLLLLSDEKKKNFVNGMVRLVSQHWEAT